MCGRVYAKLRVSVHSPAAALCQRTGPSTRSVLFFRAPDSLASDCETG